jgi:hypothetical protein
VSGQQIGSVIGNIIGTYIGGPVGGAIGSYVGGQLGGAIDPADNKVQRPPIQASEYGRPIPIIYSVDATGGNVIWAADLVKIGDAGGKGAPDASSAQAIWGATFAVLICEGAGDKGLGRIWAGPDKRLIYDPTTQKLESGTLKFYDGSEDQLPDPTMEAALGVGKVPAYRSYCYVVFQNFNVTDHDGNRLPFLTIEVGTKDTTGSTFTSQDLGKAFITNVLQTANDFVTVYWGSFYGEIVNDKTTLAAQANDLIAESDWDLHDLVFTDGSAKFIRVHYEQAGAIQYTVTTLASNAKATQSVPGVGAGETLYGAFLSGGAYVFVSALSGGGTKAYTVDPATGSVSATQTWDAGTTSFHVVQCYPNTYITSPLFFALCSDGRVRGFMLDGTSTASTDSGPAVDVTGGFNSAAPDPYTGYLWVAKLASAGLLSWSVHAWNTATPIASGTVSSNFYALATQCWFCIPPDMYASGAPSLMGLAGERWLATDHFLLFDGGLGTAYTDEIDGVYHGTNLIEGVAWDDKLGCLVAFRQNGYYAYPQLTAPDPAPNPADPSYIPFQTGYLGTAGTGATPSTLRYQNLAEVVTDLSVRAGLTTSDIDVTPLTDQVDGYAIANQVTVMDAIRTLMPVYYFDYAEDQGIAKFVKRGGAIAVQIPDEDLGAHPSDQTEPVEILQTTRGMDEDLPGTLNVNYVLAATNYSPATKYSRRLVGYSGSEQTMDLPLVLTDLKALEVSSVNLHNAWVERLTYTFQLPRKYAYLMPTDVVGIQGYTMRITKITQAADGYFKCEAVRDDSSTYTPHVIVTETPPAPGTVSTPSLTYLELM